MSPSPILTVIHTTTIGQTLIGVITDTDKKYYVWTVFCGSYDEMSPCNLALCAVIAVCELLSWSQVYKIERIYSWLMWLPKIREELRDQ